VHELDKALADIVAIRSQIARQEGFRGYGPATVAGTGVLAAAVATGQWLGGVSAPFPYFGAWILTAVVCVLLVGAEALTRARRLRSKLADSMILAAAADFVPAGMAGLALLFIFTRTNPENLWMLPALWQILLALGYFAASRSLPRSMVLAGAWYLVAGAATFAYSSAGHTLSPWAMGLPFAGGQILAAILLRRDHVCNDER
jgi:hypothetical protein